MSTINAPFTAEQVENLNIYQENTLFHPFTCRNQGDEPHRLHEWGKYTRAVSYIGNYEQYISEKKASGNNWPEMRFRHTSLIATTEGWICPVCGYTQNWAHDFMTEHQPDQPKVL